MINIFFWILHTDDVINILILSSRDFVYNSYTQKQPPEVFWKKRCS